MVHQVNLLYGPFKHDILYEQHADRKTFPYIPNRTSVRLTRRRKDGTIRGASTLNSDIGCFFCRLNKNPLRPVLLPLHSSLGLLLII